MKIPIRLNSCRFSQKSYIICYTVVFNTVCTWFKKILDSAFDSIYQLIPPAYIVSLISIFIKIFIGTYKYFDENGNQRDDISWWDKLVDRVKGRVEDLLEPGTDGDRKNTRLNS